MSMKKTVITLAFIVFSYTSADAATVIDLFYGGKTPVHIVVVGESHAYMPIIQIVQDDLLIRGVPVVYSADEASTILSIRAEYRLNSWLVYFTFADAHNAVIARSSGLNSNFQTAVRIALDNLTR